MRHRGLVSLGLVAVAVAVLQLLTETGVLNRTVVIPPSAMVASLWVILTGGAYTHAIALTLGNVALSACLSVAGGFALGVVIHASPFVRRGLEPYLASYYAVPTFIFYPVFVVLFGVGSAAIVAIAVLLGIVAMITATLSGMDSIPRVLTQTARLMALSRWETAWRISLPATTTYLFTGARLAVAYSFIGVIASEFILSGDGLGYAIAYAYNNFDNRTMYGLMLLVVIVVSAVNALFDAFGRRLQARLGR